MDLLRNTVIDWIGKLSYFRLGTLYILTLGTCALGMIAKMPPSFLDQHTRELSMDEAGDSGFIPTLRVCMFSCHAMTLCILVVPFDSLA